MSISMAKTLNVSAGKTAIRCMGRRSRTLQIRQQAVYCQAYLTTWDEGHLWRWFVWTRPGTQQRPSRYYRLCSSDRCAKLLRSETSLITLKT